ncbi:anthranilate phosphoribosyltransferase [Propionibacterium sp.]|uniref:anthranilate phosphoribosyltransferase n=1 Tax=Propionibacterium sp. TaxID=1977903 RepID=UPI0039EAF175
MSELTWPGLLSDLLGGQDLDPSQAEWAMDQILTDSSSPAQMAGFVVALRAKGETISEISALADVMLSKATPVELSPEAVDVVGTGGDRANTVNISTMAAIVAASTGRPVIKHGNRAASSMCGTADCLEALGAVLEVPPDKQPEVLERAGMVFLFAKLYHASLRFAGPTRKDLGIQTVFNFLGPLTNPAHPRAQAIGVADGRMAGLIAGVLAARGNRGLVFHGEDGLDELTTTNLTDVWLISGGEIKQTTLDATALGLAAAHPEDLVGGDPQHNAAVVRSVLRNEQGPVFDVVMLNAAAAMLAFDGPKLDEPLEQQVLSRIDEARAIVANGRAQDFLDNWIAVTHEVSGA